MVMFTCNNCGESLKKGHVDKHVYRCKIKEIFVCCMDCLKDFDRDTYSLHNQCVTELERYSGKDFVPKANMNKGQKKQEAWVDLVRSITDKKTNLSSGIKKILETISNFDNIPRKKAKFLNFMKNSFRYMKHNELEQAWTLLEEAMKENKAENPQNGQKNGVANGNSEQNGKRKLENESEEEPAKKKKKNEAETLVEEEKLEKNGETEESTTETFSWTETIRNILSAKNNELKLKKLRKKVLKKYQSLTGSEWTEKVENKFNKKVNKLKGVVVDNEKVRLIEQV